MRLKFISMAEVPQEATRYSGLNKTYRLARHFLMGGVLVFDWLTHRQTTLCCGAAEHRSFVINFMEEIQMNNKVVIISSKSKANDSIRF